MMRMLVLSLCYCVNNGLLADVRFPADAGVIDVSQHGALPNDKQDDTAAIQQLLDAHPSGNHVFYFPNGTYLLSNTLKPAIDDGVTKRNIFQGQSESGTVLKLMDDINMRGAVIDFRAGPAQFFRNAVRNLTIDIGSGNPAASGIRFNASNQGTVCNVTIRSQQGGTVGLDLSHSGEIGPLLIADVTIEGFDRGLVTRWQTASQTIDGLTLRGQREAGWVNLNTQTVFARRIISENECCAVINRSEGRLLLIDSRLKGIGRASEQPAIRNQKSMYLRNVDTTGYRIGVTNQLVAGRGNPSRPAGRIDEYLANGSGERRKGDPVALFASANRMLNLPAEDIPEVAWDDLAKWSGPHHFGARSNDGQDDTDAIQSAIDSGASTVYLPRGTWQIDGVVSVRQSVQRILGTEARLQGSGRFRITSDSDQPLIVERLEGSCRVEHASTRTVVMQHLLGFTYTSDVGQPGRLFLSDVVGNPFQIRPGQHVWARQLDIEGNIESDPGIAARVVNDGGSFQVLGFKTEDEGTHIRTINGGRTEVLGALHVGNFGSEPRYVTIDSAISAAIIKGGRSTVEETRNGETRRGEIGNADAYSGWSK